MVWEDGGRDAPLLPDYRRRACRASRRGTRSPRGCRRPTRRSGPNAVHRTGTRSGIHVAEPCHWKVAAVALDLAAPNPHEGHGLVPIPKSAQPGRVRFAEERGKLESRAPPLRSHEYVVRKRHHIRQLGGCGPARSPQGHTTNPCRERMRMILGRLCQHPLPRCSVYPTRRSRPVPEGRTAARRGPKKSG